MYVRICVGARSFVYSFPPSHLAKCSSRLFVDITVVGAR